MFDAQVDNMARVLISGLSRVVTLQAGSADNDLIVPVDQGYPHHLTSHGDQPTFASSKIGIRKNGALHGSARRRRSAGARYDGARQHRDRDHRRVLAVHALQQRRAPRCARQLGVSSNQPRDRRQGRVEQDLMSTVLKAFEVDPIISVRRR